MIWLPPILGIDIVLQKCYFDVMPILKVDLDMSSVFALNKRKYMATQYNFDAVSETLFLPLYALALASQQSNPIIQDKAVVALTQKLNRDFSHSPKRIFQRLAKGKLPKTLITTLALRIRRYDRYVQAFLARHPESVVVNLGCGLDNRCNRVNNGRMRWFDLDFSAVIALRRQFMPETQQIQCIESSVLDFSWMDRVPFEAGQPILFIAEALLMYLPAEGVHQLVLALHQRFPGAELVAEIVNNRVVRMMQGRLGRGKFRREFGLSGDVVYQCGFDDSRDLESWAPGIIFLDHWTYFDEPEPKLGWMRWFANWPLFRWAQWTVHYRLGESPVVP